MHRWISILFFVNQLISQCCVADEEIDLGALGSTTFTPYIVERNEWWALLPLLSLGVVALHLIKIQRPKTPPEGH